MSNDLRFDVSARLEIWVTAEQITEHKDYAAILNADLTPLQKQGKIRDLAATIARDCVTERNKGGIAFHGAGFEVTADISASDINIDRIRWDVLATPELKLEFPLMISRSSCTGRDYEMEIYVTARLRLTTEGWEVIEASSCGKEGGEVDDDNAQEQIEEAAIDRAERQSR